MADSPPPSPTLHTDGPLFVEVKLGGQDLTIDGAEARITEIRVCEGVSMPPELRINCQLTPLEIQEGNLSDRIKKLLDKVVTVDVGYGDSDPTNIFTGTVTRAGQLIGDPGLRTPPANISQLHSYGVYNESERDIRSTPDFFWEQAADGNDSVVIGGSHDTFERMQRNRRCSIYTDKKYEEVIKSVISNEGGRPTVEEGPAERLKYLVQYQESDYNFLMRMLKEASLVYTALEEGKITCHSVISDDSSSEKYAITSGADNLGSAIVKGRQLNLTSTVSGYHPTKAEIETGEASGTALKGKTNSRGEVLGDFIEMVPEVGDRYPSLAVLDELAKQASGRLDAYAATTLIKFRCIAVLRPGDLVTIDGEKLAVQSVEHEIRAGVYECVAKAVTAGLPYHTVQQPHIPRIYGPQTAIVLSNKPESQDGCLRVKVEFHWPDGQSENAKSAWVRVVQPWAGQEHGTQFIPQPDDEVVVEFMNGDPSCPLITGSVYNGKQKEFYPSEADESETITAIKTRSNELKIDDLTDQELVQITAKKSFHTLANDEKANIIADDAGINVQHTDQPITITADQKAITLEAGTSITLKVGSNQIVIDSSGITIEGTQVAVSSNATTEVTSSGTTKIQGSLVQIN